MTEDFRIVKSHSNVLNRKNLKQIPDLTRHKIVEEDDDFSIYDHYDPSLSHGLAYDPVTKSKSIRKSLPSKFSQSPKSKKTELSARDKGILFSKQSIPKPKMKLLKSHE
jgi:hypothetical protein